MKPDALHSADMPQRRAPRQLTLFFFQISSLSLSLSPIPRAEERSPPQEQAFADDEEQTTSTSKTDLLVGILPRNELSKWRQGVYIVLGLL